MTPIGYAYESLLVLKFNDPLGARPYTINGSVSSSLKHPSTSISGSYRLLCCTRDWENEEEAARGCFGGERWVRFRARKGIAMQYTEFSVDTIVKSVWCLEARVLYLFIRPLNTRPVFFCHTKIWTKLAPESSKEQSVFFCWVSV